MFKLNSYLIYVLYIAGLWWASGIHVWYARYKFLVYNHVTIKGGHVGGQYNKGLL